MSCSEWQSGKSGSGERGKSGSRLEISKISRKTRKSAGQLGGQSATSEISDGIGSPRWELGVLASLCLDCLWACVVGPISVSYGWLVFLFLTSGISLLSPVSGEWEASTATVASTSEDALPNPSEMCSMISFMIVGSCLQYNLKH